MSLRATGDMKLSTRSATAGQPVTVTVKVENSGAAEGVVGLFAEELKEGALAKPLDHAVTFTPTSAAVPPKSRAALSFTWTATLPPGREPAFTYRGKLVLRDARSGQLVATHALDLYVRAA